MEADGVDVAFIDALVAALEAEHCVDASRVFAAGHSHGASFSNHLGCYRPETFRAIAPVAGGGPWAGPCTGSVSAMVSHGSADADVPIDNGIFSRDHWLEANGCAGAPSSSADPAPCVSYAGCAEPVLWCEHAGGHEWPAFAGLGSAGSSSGSEAWLFARVGGSGLTRGEREREGEPRRAAQRAHGGSSSKGVMRQPSTPGAKQ
jgi:poly(3-hydroxybutyrate) depolymerase